MAPTLSPDEVLTTTRSVRKRLDLTRPVPRSLIAECMEIAFQAPNHDAIGKFHSEGLKAGGRDNGPAGHRYDYSPTYYAAFLLDPDGNNVEAVCT